MISVSFVGSVLFCYTTLKIFDKLLTSWEAKQHRFEQNRFEFLAKSEWSAFK